MMSRYVHQRRRTAALVRSSTNSDGSGELPRWNGRIYTLEAPEQRPPRLTLPTRVTNVVTVTNKVYTFLQQNKNRVYSAINSQARVYLGLHLFVKYIEASGLGRPTGNCPTCPFVNPAVHGTEDRRTSCTANTLQSRDISEISLIIC